MSATTVTTRTNTKNHSTISPEDPDWKSKLIIPERDRRKKTADVAQIRGTEFEELCLNRPLLMGIFEKGEFGRHCDCDRL